ncbi:MAG: glycosyltransferase family 39 protein [Candidatus Altiarchaeota archaeon]|nr:glycosyltransferase family 39 protein [Candidatus Altiarchaeota archaeon]
MKFDLTPSRVFLIVLSVYVIFLFVDLGYEGLWAKAGGFFGVSKYFRGDSYRYSQLAKALTEGRLHIFDSVDEIDELSSLSLGVGDRVYIQQSPGISFVAAPFYLLFGDFGVYFASVLVGFLTCLNIYFLAGFFVSKRSASVTCLFFGLGTYLLTYSEYVFNDVLTAFLVSASLLYLIKYLRSNCKKSLFLSGLCGGLVSFAKPSVAVLPVLFLVYLYLKKGVHPAAYYTIFFILGLIPFFTYNSFCFGSPLQSSFNSVLDEVDGKLYTVSLTGPMTWRNNPLNFITMSIIFLLTQPITFLALIGLVKWRDDIAYLVVASFLVLGGLYSIWFGSVGLLCWGWRHMTPLLPLLSIPAAVAYEKKLIPHNIVWILFYISVTVTVISLYPLTWHVFTKYSIIENMQYQPHPLLPHNPIN